MVEWEQPKCRLSVFHNEALLPRLVLLSMQLCRLTYWLVFDQGVQPCFFIRDESPLCSSRGCTVLFVPDKLCFHQFVLQFEVYRIESGYAFL